MQIFTDDLGSPPWELIIDTSVVLLASVKFAKIHWLYKARAATKKRLNAAIFHCWNNLACQRSKIIFWPEILHNNLFFYLLLFFNFLFLLIFRLLFYLL